MFNNKIKDVFKEYINKCCLIVEGRKLISFNDIAIEENKDEMDINKITDLMISFNKKKKTKKNK